MNTGANTHITMYEGGGCATLGGVHNRQIVEDADGSLNLDKIAGFIRSDDVHEPKSRLVCLENTHNLRGGTILPIDYVDKVGKLCQANNLKLHIDGARIYNASVATGYGVDALCNNADSVSICLSKGLGAPMGSVLVGDTDFIYRARRARKTLGGGMRQAGALLLYYCKQNFL
jgi:threonine aldolase